jgi:nucleoside-diphosphate-sugar epimerase
MTGQGTAAITGVDGFIGRALRDILAEEGWKVLGISRADGDLANPGTIVDRGRVDVLIHLAFPTSAAFRQSNPIETLRQVAEGTAGALVLARKWGARHVILASSGKVYGNPASQPVTEDAPANPTTFLGELKRLQEDLVGLAAERTGRFGATSLRIFNAYGPGAPEGFLMPRLLASVRESEPLVLGEMNHRRDWIHVTDVCGAFSTVLRNPPETGRTQVCNVGTGRSHSVRDILGILEGLTGRRTEFSQDTGLLRPGEAPDERAECRVLRSLGWRSRIGLEDGLRDLLGR